jgi:membrane-associated phospholipid phosphatase
MFAISFFGSGAFLGAVAGLGALFFAWRRSWHRLLTLLLVVPGGALIDVVVKHLIHRQRPLFQNPIATLNSFSFPSGHTMGATLFYGLMAMFALQVFRGWKLRAAAVHGAGVMVALVGFSRICLGLHFLSDVLGAMAAGVAWLALCVTGVETLRRRRERPPR